ncbi:MAG TPA: phosphomannomutase, partial [Candidatus Latescibacteria bacterium]|nr:phosphomannomutase [Candidatus Latescibacterota bacterium]
MNPNIFREYDIRGLHETDLTSDLTMQIGRALGTELIRRGESSLCVGRDVRPSGVRLREALVEG